MDTSSAPSISVNGLGQLVAAGRFPVLIDVRREEKYAEAADIIRGARRRRPDAVAQWAREFGPADDIVVYCVFGHEVSMHACAELIARGLRARYLEGGIEAWRAASAPLQAKPPADPGRWITRERPKIDRIACPWLVRRFIDPDARFIYVPSAEVFAKAEAWQAIPYDIPGADYTHDGPKCSFDTFITKHELGHDAALVRLADIVRAADTGNLASVPQASGLMAISLGLSVMIGNDDEMLDRAMTVYDALYAWCASASGERHGWPPAP